MLIPTKHENLEKNILVLGADIITFLKKKPYNIEFLFQEIKKLKSVSLDQFYDTLTFLWLVEIIGFKNHQIYIRDQLCI